MATPTKPESPWVLGAFMALWAWPLCGCDSWSLREPIGLAEASAPEDRPYAAHAPGCSEDRYVAHVERAIDADTVELRIDLPLEVSIRQRVRVAKIDAPERYTVEGRKATDFALVWLDRNLTLQFVDYGRDKYGRRLGELRSLTTGQSLGDALIESGNAVPYLPRRGTLPKDGPHKPKTE